MLNWGDGANTGWLHAGTTSVSMMGDDSTVQAYGGVDAIPTTFLIDRQGKIAAIHIGLDAGRKQFEDSVDLLLREGDARHATRTRPAGRTCADAAVRRRQLPL